MSLAFINCVIQAFGSSENLAQFLMINTPYQLVGTAILGLVSNCAVSVFLAIAYLKGIIGFPAFLSGLISVTGLGLATLVKRNQNSFDNTMITFILLATAIVTGLIVYYNLAVVDMIKEFFVG